MSDFYKQDEITNLKQLGIIEEGTDTDAGKYRLTAKGLKHYDRLVESVPAKDQVLMGFKADGNAYKTEAEIKGLIQ